jgi:5'-methylthioadenosine phosphorylase
MIDVGIITGSGLYELPADGETRHVESRFGEADVSIFRAGEWTVGSVSRHRRNHRHLPHTVPHRANVVALKQLGARAVLATTVVGAVDPGLPLGRPILFDDLFFPANLLPDGSPCTVFTDPEDPARGHLIWDEPFAPRLRSKLESAAGKLDLEIIFGGVYGHTSGPRFESRAEIRWLAASGVTAVSQTCGPETVLAGELELPYALVGFPVNYATGVSPTEARREELDRLLALSAKVLPGLLLGTVEMLRAEDLAFDHGYVYRVEGGVGTLAEG